MYTLHSFYSSKQWQKLIEVIKLDRVKQDGQIICEHCGKPIVDKYDCIAHHTIFLTEENVNNSEISLNPDLIMLCHHACHSRIHHKLGYTKREIFLVYGPPLAGKSTYVRSVSSPGDLLVDIDSIWVAVSGQPIHTKPPKLNAVVFNMRDKLMEIVKYRVGKWDNCYIVGGFPLVAERERMCRELGAREIFIDISKAECLARLESAGDRDKDEYKKFIEDWFRRNGGNI